MTWTRAIGRFLGGALAALALALSLGFAVFVQRLDWVEPGRLRETDGAVVLTGGADRISEGVNILAKGYTARLLITGVNQATSSAEIARLAPEYGELFSCCVDLDYRALNTEGNAVETRVWARARAMRSLTVVTSNYHMPRALLELHAALPDVELSRYSVVPDHPKGWRSLLEPQLGKVLVLEYFKYLRAAARLKLFPLPVPDSLRTQTADTPRGTVK
jgi:uncharacterized SAM-binding protein YcdF (DUF218 family)